MNPPAFVDLLNTLREKRPLVQCITNYVAMNWAANVMLAAGASPAMVHAVDEAAEFASISDALTINIGTLSADWLTGMLSAVDAANKKGIPWVLDPVAHFATSFRRDAVEQLLQRKPTVIRGNASEIIALAGMQSRGRGVDSGDSVALAETAATMVAKRWGSVVAVTGATDFVSDGVAGARITGGSSWMPQVTATGCALTCVIGAFAGAAATGAFAATISALSYFAAAGEKAHVLADGPGSFSWRFLDALASDDFEDRGERVEFVIP
jgi:hydroxyethylthiazole kinase